MVPHSRRSRGRAAVSAGAGLVRVGRAGAGDLSTRELSRQRCGALLSGRRAAFFRCLGRYDRDQRSRERGLYLVALRERDVQVRGGLRKRVFGLLRPRARARIYGVARAPADLRRSRVYRHRLYSSVSLLGRLSQHQRGFGALVRRLVGGVADGIVFCRGWPGRPPNRSSFRSPF